MKQLGLRLSIVAAALSFSAHALAATQQVTANISFATPLTLTKTSDINFGTVSAGSVSTYRISTAGAVTTTVGTGQLLSGTPTAASITIAGSTTQTLNIKVDNYTANNGVTPSNATCSYNNGASGSCTIPTAAAAGAGKVLKIGVDVATDGTQTASSTAAPTFTTTVIYN